jgi:hypothetical protein
MKNRVFIAFWVGAAAVLPSQIPAQAASAHISTKTSVRVPHIEPVKRPGTPLSASPIDLSKYGYEEQEYFVAGKAKRYIFPDLMKSAIPVDDGHKYKTRVMVRRPTDPAKFNGTVVIEWQNVTLGQDIDFNWAASREYLMRHGYAVVSVSAQLVGINHLNRWDSRRYGDLTAAAEDTNPKDPLEKGDVLSWDIFSQTVKAVRTPGRVNLLPNMRVKYVIATGESQAGRRLTQYYNSIDPIHRLVDGMVFYDPGYNTWSLLRTDNPTKLISVGSEVHTDGRAIVPDSQYTRRWEVAGTSHLSSWDMQYVDAMTTRDKSLDRGGVPVDTVQDKIVGCANYPLWSAVPMHKVLDAAFDQVNKWIKTDIPASPGVALEREADGKSLRHTSDGKTFGGIQLAEFAYPTARNLGYLNRGPGFCRNGGFHRFYTAAELDKMYPDKPAYIVNVAKLTSSNVQAGYLLPEDAMDTIAKALEPFE